MDRSQDAAGKSRASSAEAVLQVHPAAAAALFGDIGATSGTRPLSAAPISEDLDPWEMVCAAIRGLHAHHSRPLPLLLQILPHSVQGVSSIQPQFELVAVDWNVYLRR